MPNLPAPQPVELAGASTALIVLDVTDRHCGRRPQCRESLPVIRGLVDRCRDGGAKVVYTLGPGEGEILPEAGLRPDDPVVRTKADKFFGTGLEQILRDGGVTSVVLVGTSANGAVLYTAYAAGLRGLTVVVPVDGVSADDAEIRDWALWQLVNQPGQANPGNDPLKPGAVTLTAGDLVTLRGA